MKKRLVKLKILVSIIGVALISCVLVLLVLSLAYRDNVQRFIYENIDHKKSSIQLWISNTMESALVAASNLSNSIEFIDAIKSKNINSITDYAESVKYKDILDYGLITDGEGNILLRTHDVENIGGNASEFEQVRLALDGEINSSITRGEGNTLRISSVVPVFDNDDVIVGTVTFGRSLDNILLSHTLKSLTDSDITIFDGIERLSSTLHFSSLYLLTDEIRNEIVQEVLQEGNEFKGELHLVNINVISVIYPLYGTSGDIEGMLLVGVTSDKVFTEVFNFTFRGSIVAAILLVLVIFLAIKISGSIDKKFTSMQETMMHREKLLEAVNRASILLLEIDETDEIKDPLVSSMVIIGNSMSCDHVHLWQAKTDENNSFRFVRNFSWVSDYAKSRTKAPKTITITNDSSKLDWMEKFLKGEYISGIISEMPQNYQDHLKPLHTKSITMIPVFLENQFWGMFTIDFINKETVFQESEVAIFRSISLMMANIVRRHDLQNENLKVYTDALTGIHNRRFFDKSMGRIISSLSRSGGELSLMMIDIDYFKKYNDTYGHGPGDECLIKVAGVLSDSVQRVDDFVARYGGEEFVAVLPNTGKEGAIAVAEKMLENIREANIEHKASEVSSHVTFSIGVTTGIVTQFHTIDNFLLSADDFLYKSKNDGRNRYTHGEIPEK